MKSFKEFLVEQAEHNYEPGVGVKFNVDSVSKYVDNEKLGGFDYGKVLSRSGDTYKLRMNNGNEIDVKAVDIYAFGNADET